jgi:hypothetical protein
MAISINRGKASKDYIFQSLVYSNLTRLLLTQTNVTDNQIEAIYLQPKYNNTSANLISIKNRLKPAFIASCENHTSPLASTSSTKCLNFIGFLPGLVQILHRTILKHDGEYVFKYKYVYTPR